MITEQRCRCTEMPRTRARAHTHPYTHTHGCRVCYKNSYKDTPRTHARAHTRTHMGAGSLQQRCAVVEPRLLLEVHEAERRRRGTAVVVQSVPKQQWLPNQFQRTERAHAHLRAQTHVYEHVYLRHGIWARGARQSVAQVPGGKKMMRSWDFLLRAIPRACCTSELSSCTAL